MTYATEQGILNGQWNAAEAAFQAECARQRPSVLMRPALIQDGNAWLAIYGDLPTGVVGSGSSPAEAMADLDAAWTRTDSVQQKADADAENKASYLLHNWNSTGSCARCGFRPVQIDRLSECLGGRLPTPVSMEILGEEGAIAVADLLSLSDNQIMAERERCAVIAENAVWEIDGKSYPVEYREEIAAAIRDENPTPSSRADQPLPTRRR